MTEKAFKMLVHKRLDGPTRRLPKMEMCLMTSSKSLANNVFIAEILVTQAEKHEEGMTTTRTKPHRGSRRLAERLRRHGKERK